MKKYIGLLAVALIFLLIFSNTTYQQQTIVPSLRVILADEPFYDLLSGIELTYWGTTISVETRGYYYFVEFLIRKGTHFIGFGLIATLLYIVFRRFKLKLAVIYAIATVFSLACLDEYRQTFLAGRTGTFEDVLLDTAGAITLVILCKILLFLKNQISNRKVNSYSN